jgi:hypothetical protein
MKPKTMNGVEDIFQGVDSLQAFHWEASDTGRAKRNKFKLTC